MVCHMNHQDRQIIESVLFSATEPLSVATIKEITQLPTRKIKSMIDELIHEYDQRPDTAMHIVRAGKKYVMQLKNEYVDHSLMIAPPDIDDEVLKTLALIAFHQPLKQSNLRRMAGEKIYEHVDQLSSMNLVHCKKHRNTEMLTLTKKFPEYFGLEVTKPEDIREYLMKQVAENVTSMS